MDLGLSGKNVVITGASRGIGRATALQFASEGANVAICARGLEALEKTEKELQAHGGAVFAKSCDVSDLEALSEFLGEANKALGGVDILVNNPSGFGLTDDEAGWNAGWSVDMMASVRAVWQVTPWMEARGGGAIRTDSTREIDGSGTRTEKYQSKLHRPRFYLFRRWFLGANRARQ